MNKRLHPAITWIALFTFAFLYVPLLSVAIFSVNATRYSLVWKGFTLNWYIKVIHNPVILSCAWHSLELAVISTIVSTILGTALAIGMDRFPWTKKVGTILDQILYLPVVVPDIIFAAALVVAFGLLRMFISIFQPGLLDMIIGHITFQISFVALVVRSRLVAVGKDIEEAARDLFATTSYLLRRVTIPLLIPGIMAGAMLAFTLSLDDFIISYFTAGPNSITLPIYIFGAVRRTVTPEIHALSTLILLVTVISIMISERFSRK